MGKILVYATLILIISVIYGSLILWTGGQTALLTFNTFVASFLVLILFEPVKLLAERMTNRLFFKQKSEFKRDLDFLKEKLADAINQDQLIKVVLNTFQSSHRISGSSIYFLDQESGDYFLKGKLSEDSENSEADSMRDRFFINRIQNLRTPLLLDELEREIWEDPRSSKVSELKQLSRALAEMDCQVSIPLVSQSRVIGLLNLKSGKSLESFSRDEIDLLIRVADWITLSLEKVEVYEKMKEKERLIALGEMATGLAHEIRNPLGAIKGASQYLLPDMAQSDAPDLLKVINEEVNRLNRVVSRFLDYASPFSLNLQKSSVNEIVTRSVDLIAREDLPDNIEIERNLARELPEVEIDQDQLKQVFLNLILNGIQAMPAGGILKISTYWILNDRNLAISSGKFGVKGEAGQDEFIQVKFEDNGEGIPAKDLRRIFSPFFTTKERGVGLGLAISRRIMEAHGGDIRVTSEIGKGSQFYLSIPIKKR
jgi:signal transduction histidine kinase